MQKSYVKSGKDASAAKYFHSFPFYRLDHRMQEDNATDGKKYEAY